MCDHLIIDLQTTYKIWLEAIEKAIFFLIIQRDYSIVLSLVLLSDIRRLTSLGICSN